jgi:3-methylcrotonyl-CoA carboxylase alpha subunit
LKHESMRRIQICEYYHYTVLSPAYPCARNFIPDSGKLLHLRTPPITDTVRVDAGFVAGDEVSSHYDPMIAKLIVRGPTRQAALQKLHAALEQYEVAGPVTNIEFLKRMCVSADFVAGEVETGYIEKHREELFERKPIPTEVLAQAAIGLLQEESSRLSSGSSIGLTTQWMNGSPFHEREFHLVESSPDGKGESILTTIRIGELRTSGVETQYSIVVGDTTYEQVLSSGTPRQFVSYFPHTRLETTLIRDEDRLTIFQQGKQYRLQIAQPKWAEKALGIKDVTNSVLAPMPCKVLRVDVEEGDHVKKDQPLVVIESMKMETVIRSPHDGVIARIVHGKGVSVTQTMLNGHIADNFRIFARLALLWWSFRRRVSLSRAYGRVGPHTSASGALHALCNDIMQFQIFTGIHCRACAA